MVKTNLAELANQDATMLGIPADSLGKVSEAKPIPEGDWNQFIELIKGSAQLTEQIEEIVSEIKSPGLPEEKKREIERLALRQLKKISENLGSNEGGWYEDPNTKERYYVKFYRDTDQMWCEYIASKIYRKIGIYAPICFIDEVDGRTALLSKAINGATSITEEQMSHSNDVLSGFVADAYLASWDSLGLVYDNIVRGEDGHDYRIDSGGVLIFEPEGTMQTFHDTDIPELAIMHDRRENPDAKWFYTGRKTFSKLTESEISGQARSLVDQLCEADIDEIVDESQITSERKEIIRRALKGRRKYLVRRYNIRERTQLSRKIVEHSVDWDRQRDVLDCHNVFCIKADRNLIENQQISVAITQDHYVFSFKLVRSQSKKIRKKFEKGFPLSKDAKFVEDAVISFIDRNHKKRQFTNAFCVEDDDSIVKVSKSTDQFDDPVLCAEGLVEISLPKEKFPDISQLEPIVTKLIARYCGIHDVCYEPDTDAEEKYMKRRYAWHHMIPWLIQINGNEHQRLVRKDVCLNYSTFVQEKKYQDYQAIDRFVVLHNLAHVVDLVSIIKLGALLSSTERYRRGIMVDGMSTSDDLRYGGGDSIFTRIYFKSYFSENKIDDEFVGPLPIVIFRSSLLDRTDWWCQNSDTWGKTEAEVFSNRISPTNFFIQSKSTDAEYTMSNEQMFRYGISTQDVAFIAVSSETKKDELLTLLRDNNISEMNGRPIEEIVIVVDRYSKIIEMVDLYDK